MADPNLSHLPQYTWATAGKYLGFMIGQPPTAIRGRPHTEKFTTRLREWPWSKLGLRLSLRIYNTFILPALFFIAQLPRPPSFTIEAEKHEAASARARGAPWRTFSTTVEARSLQHNADAAMLRTAPWENSTQCGTPWQQIQRDHDAHLRATPFLTKGGEAGRLAPTPHRHNTPPPSSNTWLFTR
jgi:hypothetical protein